jgi:uracil phosphoribosyltransferase
MHVYEAKHPLIQHHLAKLRDKQTDPAEFRRLIQRLSVLLAYEATQNLPLNDIQVETPLTTTTCRVVQQRIGLVPILRAGLGMVDGILNLIPDAEVWHLGVYRDEKTMQPVEYYCKLPGTHPVDIAMVVDPMLATGGSAIAALQTLQNWGVKNLKMLAVIASQEGIQRVQAAVPAAEIYACTIDPELNSHKYIVPGLGDAGDRIFNTISHD